MTDFQACADDHVDTSSSVTSACYICRSCLSSPKGRRTLDSVSEQNRKTVSFIERFVAEVPISTQQSIRLYLCKPCFSRVDKARRATEEAEKTINSLRVQVRGGSHAPVVFIVAAKGDDPEDTPQSSSSDVSPSHECHERSSVSANTPTRRGRRRIRVRTPISHRVIFGQTQSPNLRYVSALSAPYVVEHKR